MSLDVRPCTEADLRAAVTSARSTQAAEHYTERHGWQENGAALLLLAWHGTSLVGRVTLTLVSKYDAVRSQHPGLAELNALGAEPTGQGIGTALIETSMRVCREREIPELGLAVERGNPAVRLYRRLGFEPWSGGSVVDVWTERRDDGTVVEHADPCDYLLRPV